MARLLQVQSDIFAVDGADIGSAAIPWGNRLEPGQHVTAVFCCKQAGFRIQKEGAYPVDNLSRACNLDSELPEQRHIYGIIHFHIYSAGKQTKFLGCFAGCPVGLYKNIRRHCGYPVYILSRQAQVSSLLSILVCGYGFTSSYSCAARTIVLSI